jgi:undecaprenyl-diphosphatase
MIDIQKNYEDFGTTLGYFARDWVGMARGGLRWIAGDRERHVGAPADAHVLALIIVGSVPIAIAGFALEDWVESEVRSGIVASAMLIIFAFVLLIAERIGRGDRSLHDARPRDATFIGAAQAIALIPGVSRSGITISAALVRNLDRTSAAHSRSLTPAIGGAALTLGDAISGRDRR